MSWNRTEGWHQYGILNFKGHPYHTGPDHRRFQKKERRRAQRRDNHKEIEAQLEEVAPYFIGKKMYWPTMANVFAPIPEFMMDDWERSGMVFFRQWKSVQALRKKKGVLGWKQDVKRIRKAYSWCDETLFEMLTLSVNRS